MSSPPDAANDDLTNNILGVAIEAHRELGRHQPEAIYRRALAVGLRDEGMEVSVEHEFDIEVYGKTVGQGAADLLVEGEVVLELKSVNSTTDDHFRQLGRNVGGCPANRGLLLNFGNATLEIRRFIESDSAA